MSDDLEARLGTALRGRFPMPTDVDLLPQLERSEGAPRSRLCVVVAVGVCVAVVAALSIVLAVRGSNTSHQPVAAAPLIGITWEGSAPNLTVVFTDHTIRIFDGCTNELRDVTIGVGVLDIGNLVGPGSACSGTPNGPPPSVAAFDTVLSSPHLTWQRAGDNLQLTNGGGQSVELHVAGAALSVTGQEWALERYDDPRAYTHEGDYRAARLIITNTGAVRASDLCNDITGSAAVTDTTIAFTDMRSTERRCSTEVLAAVNAVVDHVLSGRVTYAIRGNELIIYGAQRGQLIYTPSP